MKNDIIQKIINDLDIKIQNLKKPSKAVLIDLILNEN